MQTRGHRPRRWIVLPLTGLLLLSLVWLRGHQQAWLAQRALAQLDETADESLPTLLRNTARLGEPGLCTLVQALGSPRATAAAAARQALLEELARWEMLSPSDAANRIELLASELSRATDRFGPRGRAATEAIAQRILAWPRFDELPQSLLVAHRCEGVLKSARENSRFVGTGDDGQPLAAHGAEAPPDERAIASRVLTDASHLLQAMHHSALPTGGSSPAPFAPMGDELRLDEQSSGTPASSTITNIRANSDERGAASPPGLLPLDMSHARPLAASQAENTTERAPSAAQVAISASNEPALLEPPGRMRPAIVPESSSAPRDSFEVAAELASSDPARVQQAEEELRRRGFLSKELELARRLADPDPAVRARWAAALPGIAEVDARAWLVWLSSDPSADVRHIAITLMATTGDPALVKRAYEAAHADDDARINRIAEQLGKQAPGTREPLRK